MNPAPLNMVSSMRVAEAFMFLVAMEKFFDAIEEVTFTGIYMAHYLDRMERSGRCSVQRWNVLLLNQWFMSIYLHFKTTLKLGYR